MATAAPTYDLVMLLDPDAEEPARSKLVSDAQTAIEAQGELVRHDRWGTRALAYPIRRRTAAEYHLFQFHAGSAELLAGLNRSLRIADEILRFRIIKLAPGTPDAPATPPSAPLGARRGSEPSQTQPAEQQPAPAAEPAAEQPAEQPARSEGESTTTEEGGSSGADSGEQPDGSAQERSADLAAGEDS